MNKIFYIAVFIVSSFSWSVAAEGKEYQVKVACEYKKTKQSAPSYEYLKTPDGKNDLMIKAFFNEINYEIPVLQHQELANKCKEWTGKQNLIFTAMNASIDSMFAKFYPLKEIGHSDTVKAFSKAKKIYEYYPNTEIVIDNILDVPDKQSKDFFTMLDTVADERENIPAEFFLSDNVRKDFPRDDLSILDKESNILYQQSSGKVRIREQAPKTYDATQKINYSLEPFNILEKEINKNDEYKTPLLRKFIGTVFHTRMQGFEQPGLVNIINRLNIDPSIMINVDKGTRAKHSIKIIDSNLHVKTEFDYSIVFINGTDRYSLGSIKSERSVTLDLNTGKFGPEKITLTKQ